MNILKISKQVLMNEYRGCGRAWAAVVDGCVVALRYMDQPYVKVPADNEIGFLRVKPLPFTQYRETSRAEMASIGAVVSGECSCGEFLSA